MMALQSASGTDQVASREKSRQKSERLSRQFLHKINFTGGDESPIEVRVKRGGAISGKVHYTDGSPAANVNVEIFGKQGDGYAPMLIETIHGGYELKPVKTDGSGLYRITGLLPGKYVLSVTEPSANTGDEFSSSRDVQSLLMTYYPSATDIKQAQPIQVELAHETSGMDIILTERNLHTITGTLTTRRNDKPIAGAKIFLYGKDAAKRPAMTGRVMYTKSDEEGHWAFYEIPDGQYVIQFSPELEANETWSSGDVTGPQNFVEVKRELTVDGDTPAELAIKVARGVG